MALQRCRRLEAQERKKTTIRTWKDHYYQFYFIAPTLFISPSLRFIGSDYLRLSQLLKHRTRGGPRPIKKQPFTLTTMHDTLAFWHVGGSLSTGRTFSKPGSPDSKTDMLTTAQPHCPAKLHCEKCSCKVVFQPSQSTLTLLSYLINISGAFPNSDSSRFNVIYPGK